MIYRSTQNARRELSDLAQTQGGYFTAKQAAAVGYGKRHLDYHVKAGNFERVERGLFRLPEVPPAEYDDLIRLSLWSRGRDDRPQAAVSHETALAVHGLGELLPTHTHLTVPRSFRKKPPDGCVLHKSPHAVSETEEREGFRVTVPLCTLLDVAAEETVTQEQLNQVVKQALAEGLVRRAKLRTFAIGLKSDFDAVNAGLTTVCSSGLLDGQVNRLKLIKRQMYGRANFDLLRQRMLYTG